MLFMLLAALLPAFVAQGCGDSPGHNAVDAAASSDAATSGDGQVASDAAGDLGDAGVAKPVDCKVTLPTACTKPAPRYADVQPIFAMRCASCHNASNPDGNWPLTSYQHVADWNLEIRDQISKCTMPPPVAKVPITLAERERILMWLRCGFPN